MKPLLLMAAFLSAFVAGVLPACAEELALSFPVTRAGQPVVGAPVSIVTFDLKTGNSRPPILLRTDAAGRIETKVEVVPAKEREAVAPPQRISNDYLVIDAPDAPLVVAELNGFRPGTFRGLKEIRLGAGRVLRGQVFKSGVPAAGADVMLTNANGLILNDPTRNASIPQLTTKSRQDGKYEIRSLQLEGNVYEQENGLLVSVMASLKEGNTLWRAGLSAQSPELGSQPANDIYSVRFSLAAGWTVKGRIINALTKRPIAGAKIEALAHSVWSIAPATSNANGDWELKDIPPQFEMFVMAKHPEFGTTWQQVGETLSSLGEASQQPAVFADIEVPLRPLTVARGRIIDEVSGRFPVLLDAQWPQPPGVIATYDTGASPRRYNVSSHIRNLGVLLPDGSFSVPVVVGANGIYPDISFYEVVPRPDNFEMREKALADVEIKVRRRPTFAARFVAANPNDLKTLSVLDITDKPAGVNYGQSGTAPPGLWTHSAAKWGQEMKVRVQYGKGGVLETTLTAATENWPQVINLPAIVPVAPQ